MIKKTKYLHTGSLLMFKNYLKNIHNLTYTDYDKLSDTEKEIINDVFFEFAQTRRLRECWI